MVQTKTCLFTVELCLLFYLGNQIIMSLDPIKPTLKSPGMFPEIGLCDGKFTGLFFISTWSVDFLISIVQFCAKLASLQFHFNFPLECQILNAKAILVFSIKCICPLTQKLWSETNKCVALFRNKAGFFLIMSLFVCVFFPPELVESSFWWLHFLCAGSIESTDLKFDMYCIRVHRNAQTIISLICKMVFDTVYGHIFSLLFPFFSVSKYFFFIWPADLIVFDVWWEWLKCSCTLLPL